MNTATQRSSSPRGRIISRSLGAFFAALAALAVAIPGAALANSPISWGWPQDIFGDSDVSTTGTIVGAFNVGDGGVPSATVNGVPFDSFPLDSTSGSVNSGSQGDFQLSTSDLFASDHGLYGSSSSPFSNLSSDYQTILRSGTLVAEQGVGPQFALQVYDLEPGCPYQVQLWVNLSGPKNFSESGSQYHTVYDDFGNSTTLNDNTSEIEGGTGQYVIGTFVAQDDTQTIFFNENINGDDYGFAMINAFQLRRLDCPPALVYDCTLTGKFKYSWIEDGVEGEDLCLHGQGLSTKVNLKAFYVQGRLQPSHECEVSAESYCDGCDGCDGCDDCDSISEHSDPEEACAVNIIYGECQTSEGIQKFFWFPSGYDYGDPNSSTPDFCNLHVEDCLNQIDSVCDGLTLKGDQMTMKTKGKSPVYGTTFYRNLFQYNDNFDECDECDEWEPCDGWECPSDDCEYDCEYKCEQNSIEVTAIDIAGALSKCMISTTRVPTTMPFNYLNFCDFQEDPKAKVSDYICAPKSLCGPFYSYWASLDGRSYYPSPNDICINHDLTIEGNSERSYPGYLFASIEACAKYRLNTSKTACANLLEDVCKGESEDGYGYLNHVSQEGSSNGECGCTVHQGTLNYGVLCVALYLQSKGYEFNKYGTENVIRKGVGLPPKDLE